jgi:hypothetical protein
MEIVIVVAIWSVIVKRGVEDILHTARGGTPHRYKEARKGGSGAWGRYWRALSDDAASDLLDRHNAKRAKRDIHSPRPERNPSQMRTVFATAWGDLDRYARATWRHGWDKLARRQQERRLRPRPGQDTVPGEVVPNRDETQDEQQDGAEDRPQDEDRPDPTSVPAEDGTALQDEQPGAEQDEDDDQAVPDSGPDSGPDQDIFPTEPATTQEGPTTMTTIPTGEVTSLSQTIRFCEDSAQAYRAQVHAIEQTQATLTAEEVSGPAAAAFAAAMEQSNSAAASMEVAAAEFKKHLVVQEAYDAVQGAGTKRFITAGR